MSSPLTVREQTGVGIVTTQALDPNTSAAWIAATIATATDTGYSVLARVLAVQTDDFSQIASYLLMGAFKNDGGTLAQVGSTTVISSIESNSAWDCAFAVSGTTIRIVVTGANSTNISWLVDADVKNLSEILVSLTGLPNGGIIANT